MIAVSSSRFDDALAFRCQKDPLGIDAVEKTPKTPQGVTYFGRWKS